MRWNRGSYFARQEREFLGGFSRKATQHLKVRGREQEESLAWRFLVDLMCAGWLVPIFPGLYWGLLLHLFFQGTPEQGCQVRCSGELFEWDLYFSQRHILQKLVQNPNRVHLKQTKKMTKQKQKTKKCSPWHNFVFFTGHRWKVRTVYWKCSHHMGINFPNMAKA